MPIEGAIDRHDPFRSFFGMGISGRDTVLFLRVVVLDARPATC
jgi:hypothetical protein